MKIIGLTGPTGAGKSSLNTVAEDFGLKVIDCDVFARKAVEKGSEGLKALVIAFGEDILSPDGTLDRKIMAQKAFSTPENTEKMNKTLLPFIVRLVLNECKGQDVLMDAPTLIESGLKEKCFATIGVLAVEKIRLEISRKNRPFHIFFAYGLLLRNLSYPLLQKERGNDWRSLSNEILL